MMNPDKTGFNNLKDFFVVHYGQFAGSFFMILATIDHIFISITQVLQDQIRLALK
jgi:hypothetical protein